MRLEMTGGGATRPAGLILAGGRSSRFGAEKAAATLDGVRLIERVLGVLAPACAGVAVSARSGSAAAALAAGAGLDRLDDDPALPAGPLAGVLAGLHWAASRGAAALVTAPCDTPLLPADYVDRLIAASHDAAVPAIACTGRDRHPLCALWPVASIDRVRAALAHDHPAAHALLAALGGVAVPFPDAGRFVNVNTVEDLAALAISRTA